MNNFPDRAVRLLITALLGAALAACGKSPPAEPTPSSAPVDTSAPATVDPLPPPDSAPAAPAQPAPEAPSPTDPSPAPKPTASVVPALDSMRLAKPNAKMGVAADLRYAFDVQPALNQPATLSLAAVARVPGQKLTISVQNAPGLRVAAGPISMEKAGSGDVYRQQYSITRSEGASATMRVLVTMDAPAGSAFGFFTVPLEDLLANANNSSK
jgi:hypothetical protein